MASLTSRLAGWAAGRLKGEKAREKTMEFVDKTGVGKLLSLAGDAALLGGAGKLAGMGARAIGAKLGMGAAGGGVTAARPTAMSAVNEVAGPGETVATIGYGQPIGTAGAGRGVRVPELTDENILEMARGTPAGQAIRNQIGRASSIIGEQTIRGTPGAIGADTITQYGSAQRIPLFSSQAVMPPTSTPAIAGAQTPMRAIPQPRMTDTFRLGGSAMRQPVMRVPESALAQGFPGAEAASSMSGRLAGFGRGVMGAAGRAGRALMERPEIVGQALTAGAAARTGAANRELERERMAQQESQFQRTYGQSEEERKREIDRQRRIAELLAPVFQRVAGGQG